MDIPKPRDNPPIYTILRELAAQKMESLGASSILRSNRAVKIVSPVPVALDLY